MEEHCECVQYGRHTLCTSTFTLTAVVRTHGCMAACMVAWSVGMREHGGDGAEPPPARCGCVVRGAAGRMHGMRSIGVAEEVQVELRPQS